MRKPLFAVSGVACALLLAAGCSSSTPTGASSRSAGQQSGESSPGASSDSGSRPASSSQVTAARTALLGPSDLRSLKLIQEPLETKPPTNKLIISLTSSAVVQQWEGVQAAARAVGWQAKSIQIDLSNPNSLLSGMKAALAFKPFAVTFAGPPESEWASELPAYEAAGVYIIPSSFAGALGKSSSFVKPSVSPVDETRAAQLAANWFISDSNGAGKALVVNYPDFPDSVLNLQVFKEYVTSHCSGCSVQSVDLPVSAAYTSQTTSTVVSELQKDSSIKYVNTFWGDPLIGFTAALQAANISEIHLFGYSPSLIELQQMKGGQLPGAWVANPQKVLGWMSVDVALRLAEGSGVKSGGSMPLGLLLPSNIGSPSSESQEVPSDYEAQFKALWHVTG